MNRREFTASLVGAAALPFVPLPARAAPPALPATAYAWAHLIARAQPQVSAAYLARHLRLEAPVARALFGQLVADGVVGAPSALGAARAVKPLPSPSRSSLRTALEGLVKDHAPRLDCAVDDEERPDASPDKPVQSRPEPG
ncbi:MAG: hypothetical protein AAGM84_10575 [Pseudomonadota bacterium]